jgi:apolipoprotein N-acyltransferase
MIAAGDGRAPGLLALIAAGLADLRGWRRWLAVLLLGALAAAAQPPVHAVPVLIVSFSGLSILLAGAQTGRRAFADGWLFGAGYFAAGLYWIANAFLVDADRFGWMIPFALAGLSLGLALFTGAAVWIAHRCRCRGVSDGLVLAAAWTVCEWLRGVVLTGFPWNPVGNVWVAFEPALQGAAWVGVYGLSAVTVWAAAGFAQLAAPATRASARRWAGALAGAAVLAAVAAAGAVRLSAAETGAVPGVRLRLVQANIDQRDKWRTDRRAANYALQLEMSRQSPGGDVTHVIWPETAAPFGVTTDPARRSLMRGVVPPGGVLITGAPRYRVDAGRLARIWNGLVAVDGTGAVTATYDKHHLVPFGEYVPFRDILPLDKITSGSIDFSPGPGPVTLTVPGLPPFSPLICYEAIFPGEVVAPGKRPAFMLQLTNDGWFGRSAGPYQHFASARLRAVEEGLPLVRSANTGISAIVDAYGRVTARLDLGRKGIIDGALPKSLSTRPLFAQIGNASGATFLLLLVIASLIVNRIKEVDKKETI